MSDRNIFSSLAVVLSGTILAWLFLGLPQTGIDDADIFLVYAHNFADGHGFVYNIGGEAVEGFTSLLWVVLCAGFATIFKTLELPLLGLNLIFGALAVGACLKRTENRGVFLLMLAGAPAWFAWCQVSLMESGLWCLLITLLGLAVAERRKGWVALLLPLFLLTRPESMLWGGWIILLVFAWSEKGRRLKNTLPVVGIYALTLAALIGFRLTYFGYPVPNTFYAKVSPDLFSNIGNGLIYAAGFVVSAAMVPAVLFILARLPSERGQANPLSLRLSAFLLPGLCIPVLVGGDHFGSYRFFQPLWPLLCLIAALEWERMVAPRLTPKWRGRILPLLAVVGWLVFPLVGRMAHEFRIAEAGRENGAALEQMFLDLENRPTVGVITAGGNKLGYSGPVFDLMGLNSTEMAHAPGDGAGMKNHSGFNREVFFRWLPDVVLCGDSEEFDLLVLNGLFEEPRFLVQYEKVTLHRNGAELNAWFRNEFLMQLPPATEE